MIELRFDQLLEIQNLTTGVFAPLSRFMTSEDFNSCVETSRLPDGQIFSLPIVFDISNEDYQKFGSRGEIILTYKKVSVARLYPIEFYKPDRVVCLENLFGTTNQNHPGIKDFLDLNPVFVGGEVEVIGSLPFQHQHYELTPCESKELFKKMGWKKIAGFQTRNIPHRAHEYLQKVALEYVDGLFIQPLIGKKKPGDFTPEAVIKSYESLISSYFPEKRVVMGLLSTKMRYAGPREAVFHAIIRRNFGCTHFIVGRDHAGVGEFYGKYDAQNLALQMSSEIGIEILALKGPYFCKKCDSIVTEKTCPHDIDVKAISGTDIRKALHENQQISAHLMRPEVLEVLSGIGQVFI